MSLDYSVLFKAQNPVISGFMRGRERAQQRRERQEAQDFRTKQLEMMQAREGRAQELHELSLEDRQAALAAKQAEADRLAMVAQRQEHYRANHPELFQLSSAVKNKNERATRNLLERAVLNAEQKGDMELLGNLKEAQDQLGKGNSGVAHDVIKAISKEYIPDAHDSMFGAGGADLADKWATARKKEAEASEIRANIPNIAASMRLEEAKLAELPDSAIKEVNLAVQNSETQQGIYTNASELLDRIDEAKRAMPSGILSKGAAVWQNLWGGDKGTAFRSELTQLINEDILGKRKPGMGPMSDNDYKVLRAGAPDVDAKPTVVQQYLERLKRFSAFAAKREELRSEFISKNKHMGNTREEMEVGGHKVKKGQTFPQFMRSLGDNVYKDLSSVPEMPENYTPEQFGMTQEQFDANSAFLESD